MKQILKSQVFLWAIVLSTTLIFQECRTNKCDGCPAMKKKVRKQSKGSI